MSTLLARYLAKPTLRNAMKVTKYNREHPFASIMLDALGHGLLADCIARVRSGQ